MRERTDRIKDEFDRAVSCEEAAPVRQIMRQRSTYGANASDKRKRYAELEHEARKAGAFARRNGVVTMEEGLAACKSQLERNAFIQGWNAANEGLR